MPSIFSHPIVPLAIACAVGRERITPSLLVAGIVVSILPDADVLGFKFGIPYTHIFGHRGFFHSICFSLLSALIGVLILKKFSIRPKVAFLFLFLSMASHGLLDAATDGGLGISIFSPFSNHRYFFPWHPITVSPLSVSYFFSSSFSSVMLSEMKWAWIPFLSAGFIGYLVRRTCFDKNVAG